MQIDESRRGQMPEVAPPTSWSSPDGRLRGWKVSLPGQHPLATPAVADGRAFLGGGFGSYEFYALDSASGKVVWRYQTEDDGPTAAVVVDGLVVFNTESCELEVLTADGKRVWKKWLGDPLMSMPAVAAGRVYQVYPDSRGDRKHYLGCFDLATGDEVWKQPIAGEVITAPVLAEGRVHLTCLDGTLFCFDQAAGNRLWEENALATTSPLVWQGHCYYAKRFQSEVPVEESISEILQNEKLVARGVEAGADTRDFPGTATRADYLDLRSAASPRPTTPRPPRMTPWLASPPTRAMPRWNRPAATWATATCPACGPTRAPGPSATPADCTARSAKRSCASIQRAETSSGRRLCIRAWKRSWTTS